MKKRTDKKHTKRKRHAAPNLWQKGFLAALREHGNKTLAAEQAKIDRSSVWRAGELDAAFAKACSEAMDEAADRLEIEARRRAVEGTLEPVFGSGGTGVGTVEVGSIRRFSDTLLIFLLKGANPKKFREHYHHTSDGSMANNHVVVYLPHNGRDPAATGASGTVPRN